MRDSRGHRKSMQVESDADKGGFPLRQVFMNQHPLDTGVSPVDGSPVEMRPEWVSTEDDRYRAEFGVFHGQIIVARTFGISTSLGVARSVEVIETIAKSLNLESRGFCLIEDMAQLETVELAGRQVYIQGLRRMGGLKGLAFCNLSGLMKVVVRLGRTFNPTAYPVEVSTDLPSAFVKALRWLGTSSELSRQLIMPTACGPEAIDSVDSFISVLGEIPWERTGAGRLEMIDVAPRWKPVVESMVLIKKDLDELMAVRTRRLRELQEQNVRERQLQAKMALAIEKLNLHRQTVEEESLRRQALTETIIHSQKEVLFSLGEIIESRSRETANHIRRVSEYSRRLGEILDLSGRDCAFLQHASPMHDAGKISIPDAVLNKPGKLTDEEFGIIKGHTVRGFEFFRHSTRDILAAAATIAHEHHERWNGKGYPRGLAGSDIHIFGRITALADVFDALGSDRCYKKAWDMDRILAYLTEERGLHFDPEVVDAFFKDLDGFLSIRKRFPDVVA